MNDEKEAALDPVESVSNKLRQAKENGNIKEVLLSVMKDEALISAIAKMGKHGIEAALVEFSQYLSFDDNRRFERVIKERQRIIKEKQKQTFKAQNTRNENTVSKTLNDYPEGADDLMIPPGYRLDGRGVSVTELNRQGDVEARTISHYPLVLTAKISDIETQNETLRIAWRDYVMGWRELDVPREVACHANKICELASKDAPISSVTARDVVRYLQEFEAANQAFIPRKKTCPHLGWINGFSSFLLGAEQIKTDKENENISFRGKDAGDEQIAHAFKAEGEFQDWLNIAYQCRNLPVVMFVIQAAVTPPLLSFLDAPNFIVDLSGVTTTGKTTSLRAAASVWGCPDEHKPSSTLSTWDITQVGAERMSGVLCDLPLILDDTSRASDTRIIPRMLYTIAQGRGRQRANVRSLDATQVWRTVLLSTGEAPITAFSEEGGTRTRVLSVRQNPLGGQNADSSKLSARMEAEFAANYGHVGRRLIEYLVTIKDRRYWRQLYRTQTLKYVDRTPEIPEASRLAKYCAAMDIAWTMTKQALGPSASDFINLDNTPAWQLWDSLVWHASDAGGALKALQRVLDHANARRSHFWGNERHLDGDPITPPGGWLGRWITEHDPDTDEHITTQLCWIPTQLHEVLVKLNFNPEAIIQQWADKGWLIREGKRITKIVRTPGGNSRMYVIDGVALEELQHHDKPI